MHNVFSVISRGIKQDETLTGGFNTGYDRIYMLSNLRFYLDNLPRSYSYPRSEMAQERNIWLGKVYPTTLTIPLIYTFRNLLSRLICALLLYLIDFDAETPVQ